MKSSSKKRITGSITNKLIFVFLFIFAVPSILFSIFTFQNIQQQEEQKTLSAQYNDARKIAQNAIKNMDTCQTICRVVLEDFSTLDFISSEVPKQSIDYVEFNQNAIKNLNTILRTNPFIYQLRFFTKDETILEIWPYLYHESRLRDMLFYHNIVQEGVYWRYNHPEEPMIYNGNVQVDVVSLYRQIEYPKDKPIGIMEICVPVQLFYGTEFEPGAGLIIFDTTENKNYYMGDTVVFKNANIPYESFATEINKKLPAEKDALFMYRVNGKTFAVAAVYQEEIGQHIAKVTYLGGWEAGLKHKRNMTIVFTIAVLLIISVVTAIITKMMMKRLSAITGQMRKLQQGDLDVELVVEGNDDVSELASHFNQMVLSLKDLIQRNIKEETAAKDAQLGALQAQINSHFFYNVLENIKMMAVLAGQYDIAKTITMLGKIMRYNMNWKNRFVPLEQELEHVENYFHLANMRSGGRYKLYIESEKEHRNKIIHKMIIQPLVENSVVHGLDGKENGEIRIRTSIENGCFCIEIYDNGKGFSKNAFYRLSLTSGTEGMIKKSNKEHNGIAIQNVYDRLMLHYGEDAEIEIKSVAGEYTKTTIRILDERLDTN